MVLFWWWNKTLYRWINRVLATSHWNFMTFIAEGWAGCKVTFYGDERDYKKIATESGIAICNHKSDVDWLMGWVIAERYNFIGCTKCMMKSSSKYVPAIGWAWWFIEFVFLKRNYNKDIATLKKSFSNLATFPFPWWLVVFPEGTRFTKAKYEASLEYARKNGLPELKHHLIPRTKGLEESLVAMRSFLDCVYDVEFAFEGKEPSILSLLRGKPGHVHILIKRYPIDTVPTEGVREWTLKRWVEKDEAVTFFQANNRFDAPVVVMERSGRAFFNYCLWSLVAVGIFAGLFVRYVQPYWHLPVFWGITCAVVLLMGALFAVAIQLTKTPHNKPVKKD